MTNLTPRAAALVLAAASFLVIVVGCGEDRSQLARLRAEPIMAIPQDAKELAHLEQGRTGGPVGSFGGVDVMYASRLAPREVIDYYQRRFGGTFQIDVQSGTSGLEWQFQACREPVGAGCKVTVSGEVSKEAKGVGSYSEVRSKIEGAPPTWAKSFVVLSGADTIVAP